MFEAILEVCHDLSNLYHRYFTFLGALRAYRARVASYKKSSATSLLNDNTHLSRITSIILFSSFSLWSTYAYLWKIDLVDAFLVSNH